MVRAEREDLADLLAELTPVQWTHDTLCAGWRVRDVAAHVISYDDLTVPRFAKRRIVDARCSMDRFNALCIDSYACFTTPDLVDLIHRRAQPRGYMAAFGGTIGLLDAMIHHQDIRRPLGRPRTIPIERLRTALQRSLYVPILCTAWRSRGLPTDRYRRRLDPRQRNGGSRSRGGPLDEPRRSPRSIQRTERVRLEHAAPPPLTRMSPKDLLDN
ncbi:MAG: hypothetical protein QOH27_1467 [Mycobacterium sp.]|jgi:uncharacterized protein (TIGR03083 family)|nr:hypothetical protein [Mycobacterium sp.]MDT7755569.1 hypothetical protein [Mycobacterium sp.]